MKNPLLNPVYIQKILKKNNLYAKKNLGQNFLCDQNSVMKIIKSGNLNKDDTVIEIGPGLGILTYELMNQAKKVQAVEYDQNLIPLLKIHTAHKNNIEIHNANALNFIPTETPYKLIANIPYYITSPLLTHFLQETPQPKIIVILIQKEVAAKIVTPAGQMSLIALTTQALGEVKITGELTREKFFPPPRVDSAILKIKPYQKPIIPKNLWPYFMKLISVAFAQKRKMLRSSLLNAGLKKDN